MGFIQKLFGGGTKLELTLDAKQIPEGGLLSGKIHVHGGKKPLTITELKVRLIYVRVETVKGQSMPKIDLKILIDNTIASNDALPAGEVRDYNFTLSVPTGTDPKGTYRVAAVADIPGVMDPKAEADLKITPAVERGVFGFAKGPAASTADQILGRFPGLRATEESQLLDALHQVHMACYDKNENLLAIEPLLARMMREGSERVRAQALSAWGTLLDDRARPENIATLEGIARDPNTPRRLMNQVVEVTAKFAEEGAMPLFLELARHPNPEVRSSVATYAWISTSKKAKERKGIILDLTRDPEGEVRAKAFGALTGFVSDPNVVSSVVQALHQDPSPDVKRACVRALSAAHSHGHLDLVFENLIGQLQSPFLEVREELPQALHWLPADPRLTQLVTALLRDASPEVRRKMAWQSVNMHQHPELGALFVRTACEDPSLEVRADALQGLTRLLPLGDAVALYRQRLAADVSELVGRSVVYGLRDHKDEPLARALLNELVQSPYGAVGRTARETLEG